MVTWGPCAGVVGLWFAIACSDGSRNAAGTGGAGDSAGAANSAGAGNGAGAANSEGAANSAGTDSGDAFNCGPRFRDKCFDCATRIGVDMTCENGNWGCPPGTTVPAECPLAPCPQWTEGCCGEGAAIATPILCDVSGAQQTVCPARSPAGTTIGDACPMPNPCDVDAETDLAGKNCSFPGTTCYFLGDLERYSCTCPQPDAGEPTWQCWASANFR